MGLLKRISSQRPCLSWILACATLVAVAGGTLGVHWTSPTAGLQVSFHNASDLVIDSIQLDFGSADTESRIKAFRISPGKERILFLNHSPGMGFNVRVRYSNGQIQEFCALRGDNRSHPTLILQP